MGCILKIAIHEVFGSFLSKAIELVQQDQLNLASLAEYVEDAVVSVDRKKKIVTLEDGRRIKYSKLVLADPCLKFWQILLLFTVFGCLLVG